MLPVLFAALIIILLSYLLTRLSMSNYKHLPEKSIKYAPFLVRNLQLFNQESLSIIYSVLAPKELIFSIEKVQKYNSPALILYLPEFIKDKLIALNLLELEDYLSEENNFTQVKVSHTYSWGLTYENHKNDPNSFLKLFNNLELEEEQQFYLQLTALPLKNKRFNFRVNFRAMVVEKDVNKKINLVKKIDQKINQLTVLVKNKKQKTSLSYFKEYKNRQLNPKTALNLDLWQLDKILNQL